MKMNVFHGSILIKDSGEKPSGIEFAQLVDASGLVGSGDAKQKLHRLAVPPLRRFSPPRQDIDNPVKSATPDKGRRRRIIAYMNGNRLVNYP